MKLLHLDTSALGANSVTRELSAAIVARWQAAVPGLTVEYRDLDTNPLPHLTGAVLSGSDAAAKAFARTEHEKLETVPDQPERRQRPEADEHPGKILKQQLKKLDLAKLQGSETSTPAA